MKKLYVTLLTFLTCGAVYALPVGNPSDASLLYDGLLIEGHCGDPCDPCLNWSDAISLRTGFWGDYVFNRHLRVHRNNRSHIEHSRVNTNAGIIAANIWDRADIFTTLGETSLCLDSNISSFGSSASGTRFELETKKTFSWSVGARATIWECGCTCLGAEAQYFSNKSSVQRVTSGATVSIYPDSVDAKSHEWQVGVGLSHRINMFVPYVAAKWSREKVNFDNAQLVLDGENTITLFNLKNGRQWGFALGVSLIDCEKASLTVEGRFGDEAALHMNGQVRF